MMDERTGEFRLVFLLEPRLVAFEGTKADDQNDADDDEDNEASASEQAVRLLAEIVASEAEDGRPDDAAGNVEGEEAAPIHLIDAGEKRGEGPQHGDETPEEDDLAAML